MRHPLIHQGEGPAAAHERIHAEREAERRELDRMISTANATPDEQTGRQLTYRSPAGDEQRLRAIPVIARGIGGAIPGTRPTDAIR